MKKTIRLVFSIVVFIQISGCDTGLRTPNLNELYTPLVTYQKPERNPVIVIPGILGSRLKDTETGMMVWGAFSGEYADPTTPGGARLTALPMKKETPLRELKDSVVSDGALDRLNFKVLMIPVRLTAYLNILKILGIAGYRDEDIAKSHTVKYPKEHFTSFQFDYDWRRDIVENAQLLGEFIQEKRRYVKDEIKKQYGIEDYDVKFDIVAHSMGGLIARYYMRYGLADLPKDDSLPEVTWDGVKHIRKLVMVGTPNEGSIVALLNLAKGYKKRFIPRFSPAILGTMPSLYQIIPYENMKMVVERGQGAGESVDVLEMSFWEKMQWGLLDPDQDKYLKWLIDGTGSAEERREVAADHLRKCLSRAKKLRQALRIPADLPGDISISLFAGDAIPTDAVLEVDMEKGSFRVIKWSPGDGKVLRSSALMDERVAADWSPTLKSPIKWSHVIFLFTDHVGMTKDPVFSDNILYYLLEHPD